jgi:hypothetical protein
MNTEASLNFGEVEMRNGKWAGAVAAAIALLGTTEFGYAQLRQVGDWPLGLIASSVGRLIAVHLQSCGSAFWLAPLSLIATGLLAAAASAWRARQAADREGANDHE